MSRRGVRVVVVLLWLGAVAGIVLGVAHSQRAAKRSQQERLTARASLGADFVQSY